MYNIVSSLMMFVVMPIFSIALVIGIIAASYFGLCAVMNYHPITLDASEWKCTSTHVVFHAAGGAKVHHSAYLSSECDKYVMNGH
jgi:hypothetical protein